MLTCLHHTVYTKFISSHTPSNDHTIRIVQLRDFTNCARLFMDLSGSGNEFHKRYAYTVQYV